MAMEHEDLSIVTDVLEVDGVTVEVTHPTGLARYGAGIVIPASCDIVSIVDHNTVSEEQFVSQAA